jgi:hypothetical protein
MNTQKFILLLLLFFFVKKIDAKCPPFSWDRLLTQTPIIVYATVECDSIYQNGSYDAFIYVHKKELGKIATYRKIKAKIHYYSPYNSFPKRKFKNTALYFLENDSNGIPMIRMGKCWNSYYEMKKSDFATFHKAVKLYRKNKATLTAIFEKDNKVSVETYKNLYYQQFVDDFRNAFYKN